MFVLLKNDKASTDITYKNGFLYVSPLRLYRYSPNVIRFAFSRISSISSVNSPLMSL